MEEKIQMKKSLKISRKVLSVVLSVLMVMSVFVFAPAASAAEEQPKATLKVTVKVTDDIRLSNTVSHPYGEYLRLVITETNGKVHTYDMLPTLIGKGLISSGTYIEEGKTYSTSVTITSSVASIKVDPKFKTYYIDNPSLGLSLEATINGRSILTRPVDVTKNGSRDQFESGNYSYDLVGSNGFATSTATSIAFTEKTSEATIKDGKATAQFKAVVVDQFGLAMKNGGTVSYSISNGASITSSGLATFTNKTSVTNKNYYWITAASGSLRASTGINVTNEQFDVTFNYIGKDGKETSSTAKAFYEKAATAPTDYAQAITTADGHKYFTGWDKAFSSVTSDLTVNAVYGDEQAHNWVSKADVAVSGDKGAYTVADKETFECTVGKETKTEDVALTDEFNAAASAASAILDESEKYNTESAAYKALENAYSELVGLAGNTWTSATIKEKIDAVNAAVEAFKKALEEDPENNYKTYTLTYIIDGASETENYYFGQAITKRADPEKAGYTFNGWDLVIPATMPANDVTVTATWKTVDYTGTLKGVRGVNDGEFTISYTVEDKLEDLIADANATIPEDKKSFVATASDADYELDYTYTLTGWTPEKGAGYPGDQTFTAVYTKGDFNYADYTAWDAAVAEATEKILNSDKYSDESKNAVQEVIDSILRDQGISYQPVIDAAIKNLTAKVKEIEDNAPASYKQFDVTFDLAGGVAAPAIEKQTVYYGEKATVPAVTPTRTGYDFAGWDFDFETAITADTVIKAKWDVATYNVTFVDESGATVGTATFNYINAETGEVNSIDVIKAIAPAVPAKEGFTGYWNWNKVAFTAADLVVEPTYAANTYKVNFYQFKGDEEPVATVEYTFGAKSIKEPACPERAGYNGKWGSYVLGASDSDVYAEYTTIPYTATFVDENDQYVAKREFTVESTYVADPAAPTKDGYIVTWPAWYTPNMIGNVTVKAKYTPRNDISVTVYYKSESGKVLLTSGMTNQTMDSVITIRGDRINFAGYNNPENIEYKVKASGNEVTLVYTLKTYTATYVADGKTVGTHEFNIETAKDELVNAVAVPEKDGYTGAWKDFDVKAKDITIEATYDTVEYTATFVDDNGTHDVYFTVEDSKEDVLAKAGAPAARDYYTAEWDKDFAIVAGNITVNAKYTPVDYTATFVDENGVSCGTVTFNVETKSVENPAVPVKDGYTVTWPNWFTPGMHGDVEVKAIYTANTYKAIFNDENGKYVGEVEYTVEDSVDAILGKAPAVPSKIGYDGGEWVLDKVVSGGMTVTPKYTTLHQYTATFYRLDGSVAKTVSFTIEDTAADIMAQAPEVETVPGYETSWTTVTLDKTAPKDLTINTQKIAIIYTATLVWKTNGGADESKSFTYTVESDKTELANQFPIIGGYLKGDYRYMFTGWDKEFDLYTENTTYTAQYDNGTFVPANYKEFDKAVDRADDIIKNNDLTKDVLDKIADLIADGYKEDGSDYGTTDQDKVDAATKALNDYLDSLDKDGDGKVDEDNLKHYAIRFLDEDGTVLSEASLVKGAAVTAPADPTKAADEHHTYKFSGWDSEITAVDGDKDYTATYSTVDYTEYDELLEDIGDLDLKDDVKDAIKEITDVIDGNRDKAPLDPNTQEDVDNAIDAIKKLLDGDNDGTIDDDKFNHYTVKFIFKDKNAADVTDESNKDLLKGDAVKVPSIEKSFEVKTADSDKTYVFEGWDPADVEEFVTKNATHTAKYKVVEYKDFNDLVDEIKDTDINDETKKEIDKIIDEINDKKNDEDGDKNTQTDVDDAIDKIKDILDKDGDGKVDDDVLNKYTVTFKWNGGEASQTVVSGKAAVAPADPAGYYDADKHYTFSNWDADFSAITADLTVNAVYADEAHNYTTSIARPEAKDGAKGTVTYTCTCGYSYDVTVDRADYTKYEEVRAKLEDVLKDVDLTDESRAAIEKVLADNDIPRNYVDATADGYDEQPLVDAATKTLEAFYNELKDKIDDNDPSVIKYYTITFKWHDGESSKKYVKGATVEVPSVSDYVYGGFNYRFLGWNKTVVDVEGDATYTAQYTEPRSMDDVKEAIDKANDIIGNDDYYKEDQKKVEDAKKELEDYLDEVGVDLDNDQNPIEKGSKEDAKITELVEKLNDAINNANKNRDERENTKKNMSGFMGWLVRLLILVRHLLGMVG